MKNYTKDNRTQGLMEKSQWNLKNNRNLEIHSRLYDFIINYKVNRGLIDRFFISLRFIQENLWKMVDWFFTFPFDGSEKICSRCPDHKPFANHAVFVRHIRIIHKITSVAFQCHFCNWSHPLLKETTSHVKKSHIDKEHSWSQVATSKSVLQPRHYSHY